uniref:Uncharacterized protein n=1 Tax=Arundo donax TaxID=35708 RepID=A0A0A9EK18_ARUDO
MISSTKYDNNKKKQQPYCTATEQCKTLYCMSNNKTTITIFKQLNYPVLRISLV